MMNVFKNLICRCLCLGCCAVRHEQLRYPVAMSLGWKTLGVEERLPGATCNKLIEASGIRNTFLSILALTKFAVQVADLN